LEADGEVLAGTADEVTAAVTERLGLSYEHFTKCVVLPQGEFARFLHDKPSARQDLLVSLLDLGVYAEMADLAGRRSSAAKSDAHGRATGLRERRVKGAIVVQDRTADVLAASEALATAEAALAAARAADEAAAAAHRAHAVRADLVAGEECPVCLQVVGTIPK